MDKKITINIIAIATVFVSLAFATNIYADTTDLIENEINKVLDDNNPVNTFYKNVEKEINEGTDKYLDDLVSNLSNPKLYK